MKTRVTRAEVIDVIDRTKMTFSKMGEKTTVCHAVLPSGFEIVVSSACVVPGDYDPKIGEKLCVDQLCDRIWMLEGYRRHFASSAAG